MPATWPSAHGRACVPNPFRCRFSYPPTPLTPHRFLAVVENQPVFIHPSSALFQHQPQWVVYHELVLTTKEYMREVRGG